VTSDEELSAGQLTAWRTFMEMQEVLRGRIAALLQADSKLSNADYTVLVALSEAADGRMRAVSLSYALQWEKSRLHHQLTRMCKRGLVERQCGVGRASIVAVTAEGRAALNAAAPIHSRHVRQLVFDRLTKQQAEQFAQISRTLLDGLRHDLSG
jgi:DNA-binding MarR family transcriptional regulator